MTTADYPGWAIELALTRGYDHPAHIRALRSEDVDNISLTHPYNWLNEDEVETIDRMRAQGARLHPYETPERGHEPAATD